MANAFDKPKEFRTDALFSVMLGGELVAANITRAEAQAVSRYARQEVLLRVSSG